MNLDDAKVFVSDDELKVTLPLTSAKSKLRLKERSIFEENGLPVFGRSHKIKQTCYVEWQIGFDLVAVDENKEKTSLQGMTFKNSKDVIKYAYELSEILYYSVKRGWLDAAKIKAAYEYIKSIADTDTLEMRQDMQINRTQARVDMVNGMPFFRMTVCHPMLVHRFGEYEICAEVVTKEKQYAAGTQPMLYVCLPITTLTFKNNIIGRTLDKKETADWVIRNEEAELSLELFRIFGMLSPNHRFDVLAIFEMLFPDLER